MNVLYVLITQTYIQKTQQQRAKRFLHIHKPKQHRFKQNHKTETNLACLKSYQDEDLFRARDENSRDRGDESL